jgi:hypothetical protein
MARLQAGVIRYASVTREIARVLGVAPEPEIRIAQWRMTITFRRLGASRWPEAEQMNFALRVADAARAVLGAHKRSEVRGRATRAIVVAYEDAANVRGCAVVARWECVIPAAASSIAAEKT